MVRGVAKKDTPSGAWGELMGGYGCEVWITQAAKDSQMIISRLGAEQGEVWCSEVEGFGWGDVQQMGGGVESLCPICRGACA